MYKICPKCGGIAEYSAYYRRNVCTKCPFEWTEKTLINKDDLISREAAMDAIVYNSENRSAVDALNDVPAIDAALIVHGRWVDIPDKPEWDQKMCSVCGEYFCCQLNYCPNCGAKMDGENNKQNMQINKETMDLTKLFKNACAYIENLTDEELNKMLKEAEEHTKDCYDD